MARAAEILADLLHVPLLVGGSLFVTVLGGVCYFTSPNALDTFNSVLVAGVLASFLVCSLLPEHKRLFSSL